MRAEVGSNRKAGDSMDLEKPALGKAQSLPPILCAPSVQGLSCTLFFHCALKEAKISFLTDSKTVINTRKWKLLTKQGL